MDDDTRRALRLRMEKGQGRRSVFVDPEEVLALLDEIDALRNEAAVRDRAAAIPEHGAQEAARQKDTPPFDLICILDSSNSYSAMVEEQERMFRGRGTRHR